MNKILTFSALGLLGLGIAGCSMQDQTYPTTAMAANAKTADAPATAPAAATKIAAFSLPDTDGKTVEVGDWGKSKATVIMFVATQCPVSNAYNTRMAKLATDYADKGVKFVGVNSNKQESVSEIAEHSRENGFTFAVLKDEGNVIADKFAAKVTPEVYVVSSAGDLVYHGQIDNSQNEAKVKERPLGAALDAVLAGKPVAQSEVNAFGCSIKRVN